MFECPLKKGEIISNRRLMEIFRCACEGGIRYSKATHTIVLVVNNTKQGLPNIWRGEVLEFAGRALGAAGEMKGANRRLAAFFEYEGEIFLFIVNLPGKYEFAGQVCPAGEIGTARADDIAYPVFPLRLKRPQAERGAEAALK